MKNNGYGNKKNNNKKGQNNPFANVAREQRAAKKAEVLEKQKKTLDILVDAMGYIDGLLAKECDENGNFTKIKIRDIIDYLGAKYSVEDTKSLSKFNYILIDLANAQRNKYIGKERIDLRILYLKEIIESSFDKSYYDTIYETMDKCPRLLSNYTFTAIPEDNSAEKEIAPGIVYEEVEEEKKA